MSENFQSSLTFLSLYNFRNHKFIKFADIAPNPVVITGPNGAGKTNILEAISLVSASKGLRGAKISELNNQAYPDQMWNITAHLKTIYGPKEIMTMRQVKHNAKNDTRIIQVDGQAIKKRAELAELIKIVWLTPPMQQLFIGSSSERRSFFDQIVSNFFSEHATHLTKYEHATRERLRLLKDQCSDNYWLSALEQNMFNAAGLISDARMQTLALLNNSINKNDSAFPKAILNLSNEPIPGDYLTRLKINRGLDAASGRTNLGPHLFDLEVTFKTKNMPARFCSTGEQKALLLNLILAQAHALIDRFKTIPILLFDEIISHLDARNRSLLFDEILNMKTQSWLTGIDPKSFAQIENKASFIHLSE
jgi:DNA replication and repair protein RecF